MPELKKIMYVEDEVDIQQVVKLSLQKLGNFEVNICSSGKEALDKLSSDKPDLILMDVMMPEMDGPATFEKIRTIPELDHIPVIFMTAKAQVHEVEKYKELGAIDVITKPFDPLTLPQTIRSIWENYNE